MNIPNEAAVDRNMAQKTDVSNRPPSPEAHQHESRDASDDETGDATALQLVHEIGALITEAKGKLETTQRALASSSPARTTALLDAIGVRLDEVSDLTRVDPDNTRHGTLSALVVRYPARN